MIRCLLLILILFVSGCASQRARRVDELARLFYRHEYPAYREQVRRAAADLDSENVVIDNLRLGIAALADGDRYEAEKALMRAYEYLTGGGVNRPDRVVASTLLYEGLKVWTGEPFEQAMAFYYVAALSMLQQDWENARAAAANSLFALRNFAGDDPNQPTGAAIESEFVLGYMLVALNSQLSGRSDLADRAFERVVELDSRHGALIAALRRGDYDTLLILDVGRGPVKQAYGEDNQFVRYVPDGRTAPRPGAQVTVDGQPRSVAGSLPLVDLWTLSQFPRWWSNQPQRKTRSDIGNLMVIGGMIAAVVGSAMDKDEVTWAGVGSAVAGLGVKAASEADPRHLACLPRSVFLIPLKLGSGPHDIGLHIENDAGSDSTWHDLHGGAPGNPAVYFLRMHNGGGRGMPPWSDRPLYSTRHTPGAPARQHYLLGGYDLTTPDQRWLQGLHARGMLRDTTYQQWEQMLGREGLVLQPGPQGMAGDKALDRDLYRHVAEGGRVIAMPPPGCHRYERLTRMEHPPYRPRTEEMARLKQNLTLPKQRDVETIDRAR